MGKGILEMPTETQSLQELWLMYYNIVVDILKLYKDRTITSEDFTIEVGQILRDNKLIDQEFKNYCGGGIGRRIHETTKLVRGTSPPMDAQVDCIR